MQISLQDFLKCIPVIFLKNFYKFSKNFGADFVPCIKLGVLRPQVSSWGCSSPQSVPGKEVYIFFVDAVPIGLQDLKYIHSFFLGGGGNAYKFSNSP